MEINTARIVAAAGSGGLALEAELAHRASSSCRTLGELRAFVRACEEDLVARFTTPEGERADAAYSDAARDLHDTIEGWQDDLEGAYLEHIARAA